MITIFVLASVAMNFFWRALFPERRLRWLVSSLAILPALGYVALTGYRELVAIGRHDAETGSPPPNMIDNLLAELERAALFGALWFLAVVAVGFFLRFFAKSARRA
ncbi:hypothetical protein NAP1_06700 [Erythrobacter sp. NAP1]|uniref:hypothetical protein n=1 Tax=Erythrobacter sp. NAP1 TaxID=237727 RepID=UPI0000686E77|nr:hypothetical protein [Erythrobacter sp. NAP1]EAQ30446.1 hypothetical protein NAP1_06700 [Erythrobacter sp. NAP1]